MTMAWLGLVMLCWTYPGELSRECTVVTTIRQPTHEACEKFVGEFIAGLSPIDIVVMRDCAPVVKS